MKKIVCFGPGPIFKGGIANYNVSLAKAFDKIENLGPRAGDLLDARLRIYEIKIKSPPIRLFFKYNPANEEIYLFEYIMKTSQQKQQSIIEKIKRKIFRS